MKVVLLGILVVALAAAAGLAGIVRQPDGVPLFAYLNDPELNAFAENFERDFPVSVSVRHDTEGSGAPVTSADPETIRAVFKALSEMTVLPRTEGGHTDDYLYYIYTMADGRTIWTCTFQSGMLLDGDMWLHALTGYDALIEALPPK